MKRLILSMFLFLLPVTYSLAQEVLMEKNVKDVQEDIPEFGPNRKHFVHLYFGYKLPASPVDGDGADIKYFASNSGLMGVRYKYKIKGFFQAGLALEYWSANYFIKQDNQKTFPGTEQHITELFSFNNLGSEFFLRFNLGKRGNTIGKFIDFGGYGSWIANASHYMEDQANDNPNAGIKETTYTELEYVNTMAYGLRFRGGFNRWVLSLSYRISDYFDDTYQLELPRLMAGVQVGMHR